MKRELSFVISLTFKAKRKSPVLPGARRSGVAAAPTLPGCCSQPGDAAAFSSVSLHSEDNKQLPPTLHIPIYHFKQNLLLFILKWYLLKEL